MNSKASACGKFILGGEHSVIYRGRALAFPLLERRLKFAETDTEEGLYVNGERKAQEHCEQIHQLRELLNIPGRSKGFRIDTEIPFGAGLGSSAALCTALCRLHFGSEGRDLALKSLQGERFFHKRASGVDPFAIAMEQPIAFRSADQSFRPLDTAAFAQNNLCFVLHDSGLRHRTAEVIEAVLKTKTETPLIWDDLMDSLATNSEAMVRAFETGRPKELGQLMNDTHFRLIQLGASCEPLDDAVNELKSWGALGAKLTGAGRGGFVLGLFDREQGRALQRSAPSEVIVWEAPPL